MYSNKYLSQYVNVCITFHWNQSHIQFLRLPFPHSTANETKKILRWCSLAFRILKVSVCFAFCTHFHFFFFSAVFLGSSSWQYVDIYILLHAMMLVIDVCSMNTIWMIFGLEWQTFRRCLYIIIRCTRLRWFENCVMPIFFNSCAGNFIVMIPCYNLHSLRPIWLWFAVSSIKN